MYRVLLLSLNQCFFLTFLLMTVWLHHDGRLPVCGTDYPHLLWLFDDFLSQQGRYHCPEKTLDINLNLKFSRVLIQGSSGIFSCNRCYALIDSPDGINIKKQTQWYNKCIYFINNPNHTCCILYNCKGRAEKKIPACFWDNLSSS